MKVKHSAISTFILATIISLFYLVITSGCGSGGGGGGSSDLENPGMRQERLMFAADNGTIGKELWITDGSEAGTRLVRDINSLSPSDPKDFVEMGAYVYFTADDGVNGRELWRTDGGTPELVKDIYPGKDSSFPSYLIVMEDSLFFSANDAYY